MLDYLIDELNEVRKEIRLHNKAIQKTEEEIAWLKESLNGYKKLEEELLSRIEIYER